MIKFLILSTLVACSYAASVRIVNGTDAVQGEFPFVVSLRRNLSHTCGATILNKNFILTAAHCVCNDEEPQDAKIFTIQYGSVIMTNNDLTRSIQVKKVNCNTFSMNELIFDSAVLELESPIPEGDNWAPVKISKNFKSTDGGSGVIVGWGRLYDQGPLPDTLQKLSVEVYPDSVCAAESYNIEHHICFGAPIGGACNGDSGTALIVGGEQVGIASFITAECGTAHVSTPNVYSRVSRYYDWIAGVASL